MSVSAHHAAFPLRATLRLVAGVLALAACKPSASAPALPGGSVVGARASRAAPPAAASTLVFYSTRSGNAEIWAVAPDGSNPRQLTDHAAQDVIPSLSRDGRRIAFQSNRAGNFDFWVMDSDGSNPMPLTTDTAFETSPAWSPDGRRVAFGHSVGVGNGEIFVVNADGTGVTRLTTHPGRDVSPSWSPDGKWIAYHRDDGTGTSPDLYIIAADGSGAPIRVTADPAFDGFVDWGRRIR